MSLLEIYRDHVLPMYSPPVFHKWFYVKFPEPNTWFQARVNYSRSVAVMSMIGYIVGLGDRHGENILLDSTNGDCVHVDLNCLFWKGLTFDKPEKVPFRLTHNMIDGMGITGYEGVFRKVCELTLSVLRANRETLLSVLETFIYDPLVEWSKEKKADTENSQALKIVREIDTRLQGKAGQLDVPLPVEGQVHLQIEEAVSLQNLSEMYIGWASWM